MALRITDKIREELLDIEPGAFFGSEAELLARYGVSRPTFRQITRMLQQEQLLIVRRGKGGGYYVSSPAMETVGRAATNFLRRRHTTFEQLRAAFVAISELLTRDAAVSEDETARAELAAFRRALDADMRDRDTVELFEIQIALGSKIAHLAGNPALELQLTILYQVALEEMRRDPAPIDPVQGLEFGRIRGRLVDAILAHEPEVAAALNRRLAEIAKNWGAGAIGTKSARVLEAG